MENHGKEHGTKCKLMVYGDNMGIGTGIEACDALPQGSIGYMEFPKIRGTILGVPITKIVVY